MFIRKIDDWEQCELGEVVQITMGQSPNGTNYTDNPNDYILVQGNADMKNGQVVPRVWTKQITKTAAIGDIILSVRAPVGDVGKTNYNVVLGRGVAGIIGDEFIYQLLFKMRLENYWAKYSTGSTFESINSNDLKEAKVFVPKELEKKEIGMFFKQLDNTIALHQRKLDALKLMKKGFLQQMFPEKGEKVPKLRFADFEEEWQQRKLEEVLKVNSGRDYKHLKSGDIPVYGTGGYMLSVDDKLSNVDGVGIGRKGTIDKPQYLKAPYWTVDTLFYMTVFEGNDIRFLYSLTKNINWKKMDESTGVPSLSKSAIKKVVKTFPPFEEQQKIGIFFKQLDDVIVFYQNKLNTLNNLKKSFLQNMFI
ncbi:restriction endonuclease subunit S [Listeria seeligeri]|uniref:restriction endonuclease subunit S n=1 Tax=Listeria seeligeri TaxID=1640 RepID=UPI002B25AE29|nr:restriction endonuclease subunit S [Listeria seeligeri]